MLAYLLHVANSSPTDSEGFYPMKARILQRWGRPDGYDVQELAGQPCWGCDGRGTFYHTYSGDPDECRRCYGTGWWRAPRFGRLHRYRLGRYTFHLPGESQYGVFRVPADDRPRGRIVGYVDHRSYSFNARMRCAFLLALVFDRRFAAQLLRTSCNRIRIVQLLSRRCIDCQGMAWSTQRWRCPSCQAVREQMQADRRDHYQS